MPNKETQQYVCVSVRFSQKLSLQDDVLIRNEVSGIVTSSYKNNNVQLNPCDLKIRCFKAYLSWFGRHVTDIKDRDFITFPRCASYLQE